MTKLGISIYGLAAICGISLYTVIGLWAILAALPVAFLLEVLWQYLEGKGY